MEVHGGLFSTLPRIRHVLAETRRAGLGKGATGVKPRARGLTKPSRGQGGSPLARASTLPSRCAADMLRGSHPLMPCVQQDWWGLKKGVEASSARWLCSMGQLACIASHCLLEVRSVSVTARPARAMAAQHTAMVHVNLAA